MSNTATPTATAAEYQKMLRDAHCKTCKTCDPFVCRYCSVQRDIINAHAREITIGRG